MEGFVDRLVEVQSTDDGIYRGYVVSIDPRKHELILRNVKDMKTGEIRMNQYHFFKEQISDIKICEDDKVDRVREQKEIHCDSMEGKARNGLLQPQQDYENDMLLMDPCDEGPSLFQRQHIDPTLYLSEFEPHLELVEPAQSMVIDSEGDDFTEAISKIKQQKVISFALEGRKVARKGDVSLVVIGTRPLVYIFDIAYIGPECMSSLKSILEDKNILKVVFDVRLISDCLASLYKIYPMNIFDCQVADIFIHKRKYGQYPSEVASLGDCLQRYLNIPRNQCSFESDKKKIIQRNQKLWSDRPFSDDFIRCCYKNVMFIRELRDPMIRQLLAEFLCGVDLYLDCVRSMPDHASRYYNPRKLPKALHSISAYKEKKSHQKQQRKKKSEERVDLSDENSDTDLHETSPWGAGINFSEKYQERHGEIIECMDFGPSLLDYSKPILKSKNKTPETRASDTSTSKNDTDPRENLTAPASGDSTVTYFEHEPKDASDVSSDGELSSDMLNDVSDLYGSSANETKNERTDKRTDIKINSSSPDLFTNVNNSSCSESRRRKDLNSPRDILRNSYSPKHTGIRKPIIDPSLCPDSCEDIPKPIDEFQISTSELDSDGSDFFVTSVNDKIYNKRNNNNYNNNNNNNSINNNDNNAWPSLPSPTHKISNAGKRMILAHITPPLDMKPLGESLSPDLSEFPPLNEDRGEVSEKTMNESQCTGGALSQPSPRHVFDEIRSTTPEMNGIKQTTTKPKVAGRGQTLQFLAEQSRKSASSKLLSPRFIGEGKKNSYDFPTDEELLTLPQVTPMIDNKPLAGELISIIKKFPAP